MNNDCPFCDRTKVKERIVWEDDSFYIIATLGQISNGGYVLLVPKNHVSCLGAMTKSEIELLETLRQKIGSAISKEYGVAPGIIFEHGIVGQTVKHAHLHFIPENSDITARILKDFPDSEISIVSSLNELQNLYTQKQEPYLLWKDSGARFNVCWNPPAPSQYLRIVVAETVGRPERASWRNMDPELDKKLWTETVVRLPRFL
ncbi:MAG: HIT family protein [bacterium]|nr:HIT family protein [bacterium]